MSLYISMLEFIFFVNFIVLAFKLHNLELELDCANRLLLQYKLNKGKASRSSSESLNDLLPSRALRSVHCQYESMKSKYLFG